MSLPVITAQPHSVTVSVFDANAPFLPPPNVFFQVGATTDQGVLRVQWFRNGLPLENGTRQQVDYEGVTGGTLSLSNANFTAEGVYFARVYNNAGHVDSDMVTLVFGLNLPTITLQPSSVIAAPGTPATFAVQAQPFDPYTPLYYNWFSNLGTHGWQRIPDAIQSSFTIDAVTAGDVGSYACLCTSSAYGSLMCFGTVSAVATLNLPTTSVAPVATPPTSTGGGVYMPPDGSAPGTGTDTGAGGGTPIVSGPTFSVGVEVASMTGWQGIARAAAGPGRWKRNGNFSTPRPTGPPVPELPFEEFGDRKTMIWKQRWRVALENWSAAPAYTKHPDRPEMFLIKETAFEVRGAGILEWERWYCAVPQNHPEYQDYPFTFQYLATPSTLGSITRTVTSHILYEYFLERDRAAFPLLLKDEMYILPTSVIFGQLNSDGTTGLALYRTGNYSLHFGLPSSFFVSDSAFIVAENSKLNTWNHPIMCRATRFVPGPTLADIGQVVLKPASSTP